MYRMIVMLIVFTAAWPLFAADEPSTQTLMTLDDEAEERFIQRGIREAEKIDSVWSRFIQRRHLSVFDEVLEAEGEMAFSREGCLRWELKKPFRSVLIRGQSDIGKWEWKDGRWRTMRLGGEDALSQMLERIGGWMQGDLKAVEKEGFDIQINRFKGQDRWQIVLTPKEEEQREYIRHVEMLLEGERPEIRRVVLYETGDNRTEITFSDRVLNPALPEGYFDPDSAPESLEKAPASREAQ